MAYLGAAVDGVVVDGIAVDGTTVEGVDGDGSAVDGVPVDGSAVDVAAVRARFQDGLLASWSGAAEEDGFNRLTLVSPLATLERGYALVLRADGAAATSAAELATGQHVALRMHDGTRAARIEADQPGVTP